MSIIPKLSRRERQVAALLASGMNVNEVAREIGTQTRNVRSITQRLKRKLKAKSLIAAVCICMMDTAKNVPVLTH